MSVKICSRCGKTKPIGDFPPHKKGRNGIHPNCWECRRSYNRGYWKERYVPHPRPVRDRKQCSGCKLIKSMDEFYPARGKNGGEGRQSFCIVCTKARQINRFYGLTVDNYRELWDAQKGLCAICDIPLGNKPNIDHCHETGFVRGLLCRGCNNGIARIERRGFLDRAVAYLARAAARDEAVGKRGSRISGNRSVGMDARWLQSEARP